MEIYFHDNKNTSVRLVYVGGQQQYVFDVFAKSECFTVFLTINILKNDLILFRDYLVSMCNLKSKTAVLLDEDKTFNLKITCNEYGHLNYKLNIRNSNECVNSDIELDADLSYLSEILIQIEDILKNARNTTISKGTKRKEKELIAITNIRFIENKQLNISITSKMFEIFRIIEINQEEGMELRVKINNLGKFKDNISLYPLGEFANLSFYWNKGKMWIISSICDYQYPYNSIKINVPCIVKADNNY